MTTIQVKPWSDDQGDYVLINEEDFDADKHELFVEKKAKAPKKAKGDAVDPLDIPHDDAGGLTLRELRADVAGLGLDVDTDMSPADLLALRDLHREQRAQDGGQ